MKTFVLALVFVLGLVAMSDTSEAGCRRGCRVSRSVNRCCSVERCGNSCNVVRQRTVVRHRGCGAGACGTGTCSTGTCR
jgi:hypothetical protein